MKYLIFTFLFIPALGLTQIHTFDCPDTRVIDFDYNGDTLTLTKVYYTSEWVNDMGSLTLTCVEHVEKEVYSAKLLSTIKGKVIEPKPKRYEFENDVILQRNDSLTVWDLDRLLLRIKKE